MRSQTQNSQGAQYTNFHLRRGWNVINVNYQQVSGEYALIPTWTSTIVLYNIFTFIRESKRTTMPKRVTLTPLLLMRSRRMFDREKTHELNILNNMLFSQ